STTSTSTAFDRVVMRASRWNKPSVIPLAGSRSRTLSRPGRRWADRAAAIELLRELLQRPRRLGKPAAIEAARNPIRPADLRRVDLRDEGFAIRRQLEQRGAAVCGVPREPRQALG